MSDADTPPPSAERLAQIVGLREATCIRCGRPLHDVVTVREDGRERCARCHTFNYVVPAFGPKLAIVTHASFKELEYAAANEYSVAQTLALLGFGRPFRLDPILAPGQIPGLPHRRRRS